MIQDGKLRGFAMGQAIPVRTDYTAGEVRRFAQRAKDGAQARRLLAIAAVLDGASRALDNASGCVSTTPRQTILPASSSTHTAVRLKPTSSPANIFIAALLPSLEESPAERVAFPPESSNLMYGMYKL
jgi:hypothetical protein